MAQMTELIDEDMKAIIVAIFHIFKNEEKRLWRDMENIKKTKIELPEMKLNFQR